MARPPSAFYQTESYEAAKHRNLYWETTQVLRSYGKSPDDVRWVGMDDATNASCSWETFAAMARGVTYHGKNYRPTIPPDLCVVGDGWWLERRINDHAEWWEYKQRPTRVIEGAPSLSQHPAFVTLGKLLLEERNGI